MPFTAYLPSGFQHRHESEAFDVLVKLLHEKFDSSAGSHILIGNVMIAGNEMDAVLFKPNGIAIVELKDYGGKVHFSENSEWQADDRVVRGGTKINPFVQVRGYRFNLRSWLVDLEQQLELHPRPRGAWQDISALVLFSRDIQFDDRVLMGALRYWFEISDMRRVAERLERVRARALRFKEEEFDSILRRLQIGDDHIYSESLQAPRQTSGETPTPSRRQLSYVRELHFRDHELRMRTFGGQRAQGTQVMRQWFEQVRQGLDPFSSATKRADERIAGAVIYTLNPSSELILLELGTIAIPAFIGSSNEIDGWMEAHKGLTVSLDQATGRVNITRVSASVHSSSMQPPAATTENDPYLKRVSGLEYEELIPQTLARNHLMALDENSTEDEIKESLELVFDEGLRAFLFDVINLVRAGELSGAQERIRLRTGEAVPVGDVGFSAERATVDDSNSDQVVVINDLSKEQLEQLLDPVNFQEWMLFLHPDQMAFAHAEFERPVVLKGVSGSGKTCILVHRAKALAKRYPDERIGILTLSKTLAGLLRNLVDQLCSVEERKNIWVLPFYEVFSDCLVQLGPEKYFSQLSKLVPDHSHMHKVLQDARDRWPERMVWDMDPISHARVEDEWEDFYMSQNPDVRDWMQELDEYLVNNGVDASRYIEEEFTLIRSAFTVPTRDGYLSLIRAGRSISFRDEELRRVVLRLLLFWEEWLLGGGFIDALGLTQALMPLHREMQRLPEASRFRCLLVDEYQDFSTLDLQLLRRIVPLDEPDALFLAGDTVQRILVKRLTLSDAGFDTGAAAHHRIKKNYRNSRQILRAASRLANHYGKLAGAQGEEIEVLDPELAQRETNPPVVLKTDSQIAKAWEIALECTADQKAEPWTVCIVTAAPGRVRVDEILKAKPEGIEAELLTGDCILHPERAVIGTMSDLKGFEFRLVLVVGCDAGVFPDMGTPEGEVWRDALRLYVAMTRARDQVFLLHENDPSPFIEVMGETVVGREEPVSKREALEDLGQSSVSPGKGLVEPLKPDVEPPDNNCESWFTLDELQVLIRYYVRYAQQDGLTFHQWCTPRSLATVDENQFESFPKCSALVVKQLFKKLSTKGVKKI